MSLHNLFDKYSENITTVDENTVITDTGVKYENIKNKVFNEIGTKKRRHISKKILLPLVATITALTLLTTTGYATGSFNEVFGYMFSGEVTNGLYSGGNVKTESSNPDLNFEVMGITGGSESEFCIAYKITKTDGSKFIDNIQDYTVYLGHTPVFDISNTIFDFSESNSRGEERHIYTPDDKTIIVIQAINQDAPALGQHMDIKFGNLVFSKIDKRLNIFAEGDPYNVEEDITKFHNTVEELEEKYNLTENQRVNLNYNDEKELDEYCIFTEIIYEDTFSASLDLNYKADYLKYTPSKSIKTDNFADKEIECQINQASLSPFSFKIDGKFRYLKNFDHENCFDYSPLPEKGTMIMNNGDTYPIEINGGGFHSEFLNDTNLIYQLYYNIKFPSTEKQTLIDIDKVKEIVIGDIVFTPDK